MDKEVEARSELWNALKMVFWEEYIYKKQISTDTGSTVLVTVNDDFINIDNSETPPPDYKHICNMLNYFYKERGEHTDKEIRSGAFSKINTQTVAAWFETNSQSNRPTVIYKRSKRILNATLQSDDGALFNLTNK